MPFFEMHFHVGSRTFSSNACIAYSDKCSSMIHIHDQLETVILGLVGWCRVAAPRTQRRLLVRNFFTVICLAFRESDIIPEAEIIN